MDFSNLQSRASPSSAFFPPHRTQIHPRMHSSSSAAAAAPPPGNSKSAHIPKFLILLSSLLTLPFLFYLLSTALKIHRSSKFSNPNPKLFGIVIHSSPSASRIRVFQFLNEGRIPFVAFDGSGVSSMTVRPGLSGFAEDPEGAGTSIVELLEFAKQRVPKKEWGNTKVQMMVSGGLEGLGAGVLESCRQVLRASGFSFKDEWARPIQGEEEGVYAWVAVNYALGTLGGEPHETTGIVELGGTSLQVTFALREPALMNSSQVMKMAGVTYNLYTQSLPQFGQDVVWESLHELHNSTEVTSSSSSNEGIVKNPCIPRGYEMPLNASDMKPLTTYPAGNFSACRLEALALLQRKQDKCLEPPCRIISSIFLDLQGKPVSSENLSYTSELFGLVPRVSLFDLEAAGKHYCEDDWDQLRNQHRPIDDLDLLRYCFTSAYTVALLHDSLGIHMDDKRIGFTDHTESIPLDWTLGAFILQTMLEPLELDAENLDLIVGNESVTYFSLFAFLLIAVLAAFFVLQRRKPQLKTIYDLEKGRYIVTRVQR